jgi:hypothetical protein
MPKANMLQGRGRALAIAWAVLLVVTVAFPVAASLIPAESVTQWMGVADVALALVFVVASLAIDALARGKVSGEVVHLSYRIYRGLGTIPLILLAIFFLVGEAIRWNVLLPGLAWRAWVLIYALPAALVLWKASDTRT